MLTQIRGEPKVETRESGLPKCAQKRIAQLRALVDDAEATRANLQKRMGALRPDDSFERSEIEKRRVANDKVLHYAKALLNQVDDFLRRSGALAHVNPTPLKEAPRVLPVNTDWGRVEHLRDTVAKLKATVLQVAQAPMPFAQIEAQLKTMVASWASHGSPNITIDQVRGNVDVSFGFNAPKSHQVLAYLHPEAMLARLVAQARKQFSTKGEPMSAEAKAERLKSLADEIAKLELEEVAIIDTLQERGVPEAQHRLSIAPWALLGVKEPRGLMKTGLVAV